MKKEERRKGIDKYFNGRNKKKKKGFIEKEVEGFIEEEYEEMLEGVLPPAFIRFDLAVLRYMETGQWAAQPPKQVQIDRIKNHELDPDKLKRKW